MTLIEVMVVLALIGLLAGIVGPSAARSLDRVVLQSTATQLAAQCRKAQASARVEQSPVAMIYAAHEFRFFKKENQIGVFRLPAAISIESAAPAGYVFLPTGEILGPDRIELRDQRGAHAILAMDFLKGIRVNP